MSVKLRKAKLGSHYWSTVLCGFVLGFLGVTCLSAMATHDVNDAFALVQRGVRVDARVVDKEVREYKGRTSYYLHSEFHLGSRAIRDEWQVEKREYEEKKLGGKMIVTVDPMSRNTIKGTIDEETAGLRRAPWLLAISILVGSGLIGWGVATQLGLGQIKVLQEWGMAEAEIVAVHKNFFLRHSSDTITLFFLAQGRKVNATLVTPVGWYEVGQRLSVYFNPELLERVVLAESIKWAERVG